MVDGVPSVSHLQGAHPYDHAGIATTSAHDKESNSATLESVLSAKALSASVLSTQGVPSVQSVHRVLSVTSVLMALGVIWAMVASTRGVRARRRRA